MRKIIVVAMREYQAAVRTKAFIIMLVAMPVMMGGGIAGQALLAGKVDLGDKHIAVLDRSGEVLERLKQAADQRNQKEILEDGTDRQIKPKYLIEPADLPDAEPTSDQLAEQSALIREGKLFALIVIGPDVRKVEERTSTEGVRNKVTADVVTIYSSASAFDDLRDWVGRQVNEAVRELRFAAAGLPQDKVQESLAYVPVESRKLVAIDAGTGEVTGGTRKNRDAEFLVPFFIMMLMFMVVNIGAAPLINSVIEEKMQRIAEVLLGSLTPFELMTGKLLGMVGASMTILTLYLGGAVLGANYAGWTEFIPPNLASLIVWFVVFQALAVLMFGAVFIGVGAGCSDLKEAQSMIMPIYIFIIFPMFVWFPVIREPDSTMSLVLSLIPPGTPMLMMLRMAVMPELPLWQPILGVVLVLLTTIFCIFVAGRVFRVGLLMQGKGAKITDMIRWAIRG